jgi:glycosyltransferase involved in cell wall biosynthesis
MGENGRPVPEAGPLLSATIICRDEIEKIRGALESVRFCDEVVVVDSGSTDGTLEVCRELADVVVERPWPGYVEQQNHALSLARGAWVLSIDADERVTPELAREVRAALAESPEVDAFRITRHVHYLGRWIDHSGWYPEPRTRLFRGPAPGGRASTRTTTWSCRVGSAGSGGRSSTSPTTTSKTTCGR